MFEYSSVGGDGGSGLGIVTDRFICLLGPEADSELGAGVYALLDDDETRLADALDVLIGEHPDLSFAIVEVIDPAERTFHVAVSGDVDVTMTGTSSTRFSGPPGAAWIIGEAIGVDRLRLALDARDGVDCLPVRDGVVRTSMIGVAERPVALARASAAHLHTRPIRLPAAPTRIDLERAAKTDAAKTDAAKTDAAKTDASRPAPEPAAAPTREPEPAPPLEPEASVTPEPPVASVPGPGWTLVLPDGTPVAPPVIFGRRPWKDGPSGAMHIVVPSPGREISGVHIEVDLDGAVLTAHDLDSTNGTVVYARSRPPRLLHDGGRMALSPGDILDLGDSYRVAVQGRST
ncbi:MAG: FHA domain-containing protein [Leifsonia flava]